MTSGTVLDGFDATLAHEAATLGVTVYQKTVTDLLLEASVAPSTGYRTRIFNGGELRNRGLEAALAVSPVQKPDLSWVLRSTFYLNRSKIVSLPVPAFNTGGFGTSLGAFRIAADSSATQIVGTEGLVGDANPDFTASLSSGRTPSLSSDVAERKYWSPFGPAEPPATDPP